MDDPEIERIHARKMKEYCENGDRKMESQPVVLDQENFDKVIGTNRLVLVDFWAEWCAPCRSMHEVFEKLAAKYGEKMILARLNVDDNGPLAERFNVFSIPTFILFEGGKPVDAVVGAVGEEGLEQMILKQLGKLT